MSDEQHRVRAIAEAQWAEDNASRNLDMQIGEIGLGRAVMTMTVTDAMTNGHKTCHGGYIFTLADSAFAFACNSYNQRAVAQMASVTFLAPGHQGDVLTADAREVQKFGRSGIYDVRVTNQKGDVIAEFRGHSRTIKGTHLPEEG